MFVNNNKIFSYNGTNVTYDNTFLNIPKGQSISFGGSNGQNFNLETIEFINANIGGMYNFRLDAYDKVNNKNSTSKSIFINDSFYLILENSINSKVDPSKYVWITKNEAPIIKFRTTKPVEKCFITPLGNPKIEISSGASKIKDFSIDLSTSIGFNLSLLDSRESLINISCIKDNSDSKSYKYQRKLKLINYLPDYVLSSSKGFVLNEAPYETNINVKSVGPYRYVNCEYNLGNTGYENFLQKNDVLFNNKIDFSNFQTGVYDVKIKCTDLVENVGPEKTYSFSINKSPEIIISDLTLYNPVNKYTSRPIIKDSTKTIYVSNITNLKLEFKLNKKNNIECNYNLNSDSSWSIISFLKNLFSIGTEQITSSENPYIYSISNFNLPSDVSNLVVSCNDDVKSVKESYKIELLNDVNLVENFN